jgi:hypothetical protein
MQVNGFCRVASDLDQGWPVRTGFTVAPATGTKERAMSGGEMAYLFMVIAAMVVFAGVLAWAARRKKEESPSQGGVTAESEMKGAVPRP